MHAVRIVPALVALVVVGLLLGPAGASAQSTPLLNHSKNSSPTNVSYASSVDHFPLSYLEWLPSGFSPLKSHALIVYLHGMGMSTQKVRGGIGGASIPSGLVSAASSANAIVIAINTRTDSGFYVNTACGGPQGQDVLDAIAHEQASRKVSEVDLVGFSMGTVGALTIAATHPSLVHAIGLAGPLTDLFEEQAYLGGPIPQLQTDLCGAFPTPSNSSTVAFFEILSPLRFAPTNFSTIPIYIAAGGSDTRAPNNFGLWPYAMANSTIVNSSCRNVSSEGEPSKCTTPLSALAKANPGSFLFRFVYEQTAPHSSAQLDATDFFNFLSGSVSTGRFLANYPPSHIVPAP